MARTLPVLKPTNHAMDGTVAKDVDDQWTAFGGAGCSGRRQVENAATVPARLLGRAGGTLSG